MRVGIIAEGRGDFGVITRILRGAIGVDEDAVAFLRPEFDLDETDTFAMSAGQRGNWSLVLDECQARGRIREFFSAPTDEPKFLVVHIDAAECEQQGFDVARPTPPDAARLCERIERMMFGVMQGEFSDRACFAIAVEESEAWVLPLFTTEPDTCGIANAKKRMEKELNRPNLFSDRERQRFFAKPEYQRMRELAKGLARRRALDDAARRNVSLARFVAGLDQLAAAVIDVGKE